MTRGSAQGEREMAVMCVAIHKIAMTATMLEM